MPHVLAFHSMLHFNNRGICLPLNFFWFFLLLCLYFSQKVMIYLWVYINLFNNLLLLLKIVQLLSFFDLSLFLMNDAKSIRENSKLGAFIWLDLNLAMIMFVYQKHQENYFVQETQRQGILPQRKIKMKKITFLSLEVRKVIFRNKWKMFSNSNIISKTMKTQESLQSKKTVEH